MNRARPGTPRHAARSGQEHRITQQLALRCPEGHPLGDLSGADNLGSSAVLTLHALDDAAAMQDPSYAGGRELCGLAAGGGRSVFWYQCAACVRSALRGAEKRTPIKLDRLLSIIAAMATYGPASTSVRLTTPALRQLQAKIIGDDPERDRRRDYFERLQRAAAGSSRTAV